MPSEQVWDRKEWTRWSVTRSSLQSNTPKLQGSSHIIKASCVFQIQDEKGNVVITSDGATILKQMQVLHPAAKMVRPQNKLF